MTNTIKGLPVAGYQPQSKEAVQTVIQMKSFEEVFLRALDARPQGGAVYPCWSSSQIEQGFMAVNRSIFKPGIARLPEDET